MNDVRDRCVDLLLEAPASVSIYLSALVAADRQSDIDLIWRIHRRAVDDARSALEHAGVWSSVIQPDSTVPYRYDDAPTTTEVITHGPGAEGRDALHSHLVVRLPPGTHLDKATTGRVLPFVRRRYERSLIDGLVADLGLAIREGNDEAQLAGVPDDLIASWTPTPCRARARVTQVR